MQYHTHSNLIKITKKPKPGLEREKTEQEEEEQKHKGTRGKIIEFTRKSRRNLMNLTARIMKITLPIFVTVTFPDDHPGIKPSKRYLDNFIKRIRRKYPNAGYLWRMEIKPRKSGKHKGELAVHYHMFIWGVAMDEAIWELPRMWTQVCKCHDVWHYYHGCDVGPIEKEKGVWSYVSKYIGKLDAAKDQDLEKGIGRVWGYGGKIPLDPGESCDVTAQEACILLRYLRRATSLDNKGIRTFYINRPYQWYMKHLELIRHQIPF